MTMDSPLAKPQPTPHVSLYDLGELRRTVAANEVLKNAVGSINPRPPGWHNDLIQLVKKLIARLLAWYTPPLREFNASVTRSLNEILCAVENLQTNLAAIEGRLTQLERSNAALNESLQKQIEVLQKQVESLAGPHKTTSVETNTVRMEGDWDKRARENVRFYIDTCHYESEEAFEKSGEWDLEKHILGGIDLDPRATVLEIGCGIGRLLKPLARRAAVVSGVDISGEMVRQARTRLVTLPNVTVHKTDGTLSMVAASSVDFCFSMVVFQHFPAKEPVFAYFHEVARVLRPGGVFRFQVNQRPEKFVKHHAADTWDGVGLDHSEVAAHLEQAGFKILDTWGEMTHYAWYTAEEARKVRSAGAESLVQYHQTAIDPTAVLRVFERIGEKLSEATLDALLSRRLPWRVALEFLVQKWSSLTDEEFIRSVHRVLLKREIEAEAFNATLSQMQDGRLPRSVFLDCLVSSKEFRDVLAGLKC